MKPIHFSDLKAAMDCMARAGYALAGLPRDTNSAAAYGSVMHSALHVFELARNDGASRAECIAAAKEHFLHYWSPLNIEAITEPVPADGWLPRQGYSELRQKGVDAIDSYAELVWNIDEQLQAIEYGFIVPIDGTFDPDTGGPYLLGGSVDRLSVRRWRAHSYLAIDDWKTGKEQVRLRHNQQFTGYAYASTKPEFWTGFMGEDGFGPERGMELYERYRSWARRGTWINLRRFKFEDAGWRGPTDYQRFALAVEQYAALIRNEVFPLTLSGDTCKFCPYRHVCGGTGIPDDDHGSPLTRTT